MSSIFASHSFASGPQGPLTLQWLQEPMPLKPLDGLILHSMMMAGDPYLGLSGRVVQWAQDRHRAFCWGQSKVGSVHITSDPECCCDGDGVNPLTLACCVEYLVRV